VTNLDVEIAKPDRMLFPEIGITRGDLADYYSFVEVELLRGLQDRPVIMKRHPKGVTGEHFYQKRVPKNAPPWVNTALLTYDSGHWTQQVVVKDLKTVHYLLNLGCIDMHPLPVRAHDLHHPDRLRIDLDPVPGVPFSLVIEVALMVRDVLSDHGLTGFAKTTGGRGMHIYVPITPTEVTDTVWTAGRAIARELETVSAGKATSQWRKENRTGVLVDYNQNARDRHMASVYSVRPTPDARVSTPVSWDEVPHVDPADFTIETVPERIDDVGDPWAAIDRISPGSLTSLLELAHGQQARGLWDGPAKPAKPVIVVAASASEAELDTALEIWKQQHPQAAAYLRPADVLSDRMRGASKPWFRLRLNLENVPETLRPQ